MIMRKIEDIDDGDERRAVWHDGLSTCDATLYSLYILSISVRVFIIHYEQHPQESIFSHRATSDTIRS